MTHVILHIAGKGQVKISLATEKAPVSVANFLKYVAKGHYDGTIFHRVIPGFMIQGGGFAIGMQQKTTDAPIENEAQNGLKNNRYTVAMARTSDPHSASAQFFINTEDNSFLNHTAPSAQGWGYAVFGSVVEGQDIIDAISKTPVGRKGFHHDVPKVDIVIERAEVVEDSKGAGANIGFIDTVSEPGIAVLRDQPEPNQLESLTTWTD